MKNKIIFVINSLSSKSGMERVACLLANIFVEDLGCEVLIVNRDTKKDKVAFELNSEIEVKNIDGNYLSFYYGLNDSIRKFQPNLVIIHNMGRLSLLCSLLFKWRDSKVISLEHVAFQVRPIWVKLLTKLSYKRIDQVITLTKNDMKNYQNFHKNVFKINNISPFYFKSLDVNYLIESKTVVSIGRLTYQKNFESLLEAWKIVSQHASDWKLMIYGVGENQKKLEDFIIKNKINNVYLEGQINDVESIYKSAAFYVMSSRFEGLPMVLIEAQSCALPIVSYDCPHGPAEIILDNENGYLVQNQNPKLLAEAMLRLISSDTLRLKFSKNAQQHAKRYSKEEVLKEWLKVLN